MSAAVAIDSSGTSPSSWEEASAASDGATLVLQDLTSADQIFDDFSPEPRPISQASPGSLGEESADFKAFLRTIRNDQKKITLTKHLCVVGEKDPGLIIFAHEKTDIFGSGRTYREALDDFQDSFIRIFCSYTETPEGQLSEGAKELANQLRGMVENCEDL